MMGIFKQINFGVVSPSFIILGAQKAGTSSLHRYLIQHHRLIAGKEKELHYFDTTEETPSKAYLSYFPKHYFSRKISFEATPRYLYYPTTARKIFDFDPNMKFIVVLRDPVKRAFSAWNMYRQLSKDADSVQKAKIHQERNPKEQNYKYLYQNSYPSFEDWVSYEIGPSFKDDILEPSIIRRGYYKQQIEVYLNYFNKDAFLFIDFDAFKSDTLGHLNRISNFLTIEDFSKISLNLKPINKRSYENQLSDKLYQELLVHFQQKNHGLESLTGLSLDWMKPIKL